MKDEIGPKERLIATAGRLFYEQGYHSTGINQIIAESKVARASMYQHFDSKDKLALAYLQDSREKWFEAFEGYLRKKDNPIDKVLGAFEFLLKSLIDNEFRGCRFLNFLAEIGAAEDNPLYLEILAHKTKLRVFFNNLMMEVPGQKKLKLGELTADMVYFLFESAIVESKLYKDVWPVTKAMGAVRIMISN